MLAEQVIIVMAAPQPLSEYVVPNLAPMVRGVR